MDSDKAKFIALWKASGWNQAELARQLKTTTATVSRWLSGPTPIAPSWVALLEARLKEHAPGALVGIGVTNESALADWERKTIEELRWLGKEDRERVLDVMRTMIKGLPKRQVVSSPVPEDAGRARKRPGTERLIKPSSALPPSSKAVTTAVARLIGAKTPSDDTAESSQTREAGEQSGRKSAPQPASDRPSKAQPQPAEDQD